MKNKSTLAKLLAEEDVFVVHKQMETAYFDSKKRELGLPIWKDEEMTGDIYDLMVCHEIGHALWTPLDMLEKAAVRKINHSFVNILEDARIEKKVKNKYPGAVGVFNRGYADLLKRDFFGTAKKNIASMNLIDRINVFFKSADKTIPFADEEKIWVEKTAKTETPDDVLDLAEELYKWMEENAPEETGDENEMAMPDGSGMGMPSEGESGNSDGENDNDGNSDDKSSGDGTDDGDDAEDGKDAGSGKGEGVDNDSDETGPAGDDGDTDDSDNDDESGTDAGDGEVEGGKDSDGVGGPPKATTDSAFGKAMDELRDKIAENRIYAKIPKLNLNEVIISPKDCLGEFLPYYLDAKSKDGHLYWDKTLEELEILKNDSKKTVAYMVKEFEMKKAADQYARAATSKTGSLDMSKLHTYKYNEDLFKKVTTLPGATNHGLVMVVDWSGSMADNLKGTITQLFNLVWFCRRVKIPFEVFAFSDGYEREARKAHVEGHVSKANPFKAGDFKLNEFKLLNFFSSNMTIAEEMSMMHILMMYASRWGGYRDWSECGYPYYPPKNLNLGGTPLNDAIIAMMDIVPKFKKETGVQKVNTVFLTDGASNRLEGVYDYKLNTETGEHYETCEYISWRNDKLVISDPVMNKIYETSTTDMTNDLLKILKNRVDGMNVVGFFIAGSGKSGRVDKNTLHYLLPADERNKVMAMCKFVNKNKFLAITQLGYDEYYVLPGGNALSVENEGLSDDLIGAGKGKLKTAFGKMAKGKIASRPLLNKFVKMVA